jgi:flagellar basal-body rod modification protein FlgD
MTTVDGLNPFGAGVKPRPNQFSEMSSEDFLKIVFTELTNQDPLQPSDSGALLQQLSTIRSIESDLKMMQHLETLVNGNQMAAAGNLIGKFIGGMTEDFTGVAGWVVAILKHGNSIYLELDTGWLVPLENVTTVIDPSLLPDDPDQPDPPGGGDGGDGGAVDNDAGENDDNGGDPFDLPEPFDD